MNKNNLKRKQYSAQFKDQALERAARDGVAQTARNLGIADSMLYYWRAKHQQCGQPLEQKKLQQAELAKLKRDVVLLEQENAFLKKAAAYFAKEPK